MSLTITLTRCATTTPCRGRSDLFFSTVFGDVEEAKALCGTCALRSPCLTAALARAEPCGVWGGETFADGVPVRKRPPGRPRSVR